MDDNSINICSQDRSFTDISGVESSCEVEGVVVPHKSLIKVGYIHKIIVIVEAKDMFKVITEQSKMDDLEFADKSQKQFLVDVEKVKGDVHYFKKQNFHAGYKRENNKGILTPQGAFDLDPENFMNNYLNPDEFQYLGLEKMSSSKKNEPPCMHHKVLVKLPIIKKFVEESITINRYYIPQKGKILSYQSFYALLCKTNLTEKLSAQVDKGKNTIARDKTIPQLHAMKEAALLDAEVEVEEERRILNSKREALEKLCSDSNSMEEREKYQVSKVLLEHQRQEIDRNYLKRKNDIGKYFQDIVVLREKINMEKAAQLERHNKRRREKRVVDKVKRMKSDNNLSMAWGTTSSSAAPTEAVVVVGEDDNVVVNNVLDVIVTQLESDNGENVEVV